MKWLKRNDGVVYTCPYQAYKDYSYSQASFYRKVNNHEEIDGYTFEYVNRCIVATDCDTGESWQFPTVKAAQENLGLPHPMYIYTGLNNPDKSYYGYYWSYGIIEAAKKDEHDKK